ncbi:hypothetical protein EV284_3487 [Streptomyces sp. BK022]|uniref:hypothetical protein n=1 Tax=Streptomyces sp. BK022 TaxID=2512123 RepID=UPI00102A2644|nr:hypothetical protein [Streptomyces sp. BK022]RZU36004.1 hypothetical protein EV284_3487 [Streptomyces sp. BK022]
MYLTTQSPVEIDTALADLYGKLADINTARFRVHRLWKQIEETEPGSYESHLPERSPERKRALYRELLDLAAKADTLQAKEINPREEEWIRRGRWNRYYLVDNTNGHVHKDTSCTTCFFDTKYAWLVEQSGLSAEELVELAGEMACTVCFPWAPVDTLKRKSKLEAPERKKARLEREAKKAEREAKKAAKAIANPDGTPLKVFKGHYPERQVVRNGKVVKVHPAHDAYKTLETLHAARGWLTDFYYWNKGGAHPSFRKESLDDVAKAVAHKEGKDVETVLAEAKKRAARR